MLARKKSIKLDTWKRNSQITDKTNSDDAQVPPLSETSNSNFANLLKSNEY